MRRLLGLSLALVMALAAAPAAGAAELKTEAGCYQENTDVVFNGTGFAASSTVSVALDGQALGTADTDATGAFKRKFRTPELARGARQADYELTATDAVNAASTRYRATRIFADFDPRSGNPNTLRVRFSVNGFGLLTAHPPVFVHYVEPGGGVRKTIRLGTARGTCGGIDRTRRRKLFPFANIRRGTWILQFDTRARYSKATSKRRTPWVRKPVEVSGARR